MAVVVVGSANVDLVTCAPRFARPGETLLGSRFEQLFGGKGANQAVAAALLGSRVSMVAKGRAHAARGAAATTMLERGRQAGALTVFNAAPAPTEPLPDALFALCDVVCPNETETAILTGLKTNTDEECVVAARAILAKGAKNVVLTLGARGCCLVRAGETVWVPVPAGFEAAAVADTTGAGDAFLGALAHGVAAGASLADAPGRRRRGVAVRMILGVGTGKTVELCLRRIADKLERGALRTCSACRRRTRRAAAGDVKAPDARHDSDASVDLAIGGCDAVDGQKHVLKGGKGAMLREKLLRDAAKAWVVCCAEGKVCDAVGSTYPIPVAPVGVRARSFSPRRRSS
ncbi:carbohydrate kinase [Aureococcus anophagefferens]|nr:carbohydrate kinase [Aureococcus anophagefferens]